MSVIDQKDIDELLNLVISEDNNGSDSENPDEKGLKIPDKIYRETKGPVKKILGNYVSPVIKQEKVVYNPESSDGNCNNKIVVRSLANYIKYIMNSEEGGEC